MQSKILGSIKKIINKKNPTVIDIDVIFFGIFFFFIHLKKSDDSPWWRWYDVAVVTLNIHRIRILRVPQPVDYTGFFFFFLFFPMAATRCLSSSFVFIPYYGRRRRRRRRFTVLHCHRKQTRTTVSRERTLRPCVRRSASRYRSSLMSGISFRGAHAAVEKHQLNTHTYTRIVGTF